MDFEKSINLLKIKKELRVKISNSKKLLEQLKFGI